MLIDWLKHSFLVKFNKLAPAVYLDHAAALYARVLEVRARGRPAARRLRARVAWRVRALCCLPRARVVCPSGCQL